MRYKCIIGKAVCDGCNQAEPNLIETYWASGNRHYCERCWPRHRDFYENEAGRTAWERKGNYYAPLD
jgi:hypothetical protein